MKVLHFSETLPGGIASFLDEICLYQLESFGIENVRFFIPASDRSHTPRIPRECYIEFRRSGRNINSLFRIAMHLRASVKEYEPDILHLHSSFAGFIGRTATLGLKKRPQIVYCAHGWAFSQEVPSLMKAVYTQVERILAKRTDAIINISGHEERAAGLAGLPREKMHLVWNGISDYPIDYASVKPPVGSGEKIRLLFVGRLDRQKGYDIAAEAIRNLSRNDINLDVVGDRVVSAGRVDQAPSDRITFHGWLPRAEVERMIQDVDAVVMPSRWEGFGLVAIEAMRAAKAVIASNRGALSEIVVEGVTGVLFEPDVDQLSLKLGRLSKAQLENMGRFGRERFLSEYTSERMNRITCDIYKNLYYSAGHECDE